MDEVAEKVLATFDTSLGVCLKLHTLDGYRKTISTQPSLSLWFKNIFYLHTWFISFIIFGS